MRSARGTIFMPCCAFAAFIISQVVLGCGVIKRFVLRSCATLDDGPGNPATEWGLRVGASCADSGDLRGAVPPRRSADDPQHVVVAAGRGAGPVDARRRIPRGRRI